MKKLTSNYKTEKKNRLLYIERKLKHIKISEYKPGITCVNYFTMI